MIDAELAKEAQELLAGAIACLFEDEHDHMVLIAADLPARAERLRRLASDTLVLADAMLVILRRAEPEGAA